MIGPLHHVGISTPDIERAITFYTSHFGFEVIDRSNWGPGTTARDRQLQAKDSIAEHAMMLREGMRLELREYRHPAGRPKAEDTPAVDHGINHFCFAVDSVQDEYDRLSSEGVRFDCEPLEVREGVWLTYARDPDGNIIELLSGL
ncbi:MAG: VOC family protein [Chloroflexi bacterium]|nr:VOC family protein [Chloroflexota bacterium]